MLVCVRGLEDQVIPMPGSHDLKTHGQAALREAGPDGCGGVTREIEGIREGHGPKERDGMPVD